jgi:hypothetical protein
MPAHKNQHFVPRCAFKPFSLNGNGKAINLFNIKSKRAIKNAPIKGQCARDYLYGKNLEAERLLMDLEGEYAEIAKSLESGKSLTALEEVKLKAFILVQARRTELAIKRMRDFGEAVADKAFAAAPEQKPEDTRTDTEVVHESILTAADAMQYIGDLKVIIFMNKTNVDFITSDNPAVLTNRFHFQRLKAQNFGLASSGAVLSMPITPQLSVFCYDPKIYSVPNASGTHFIDLTKDNDVHAINQLQCLNANKNLYFRRWEDADRIDSELATLKERRSRAGIIITVYVSDDNTSRPDAIHRDPRTGEVRRFRKGSPEEELTAKRKFLLTSFRHPEPAIWPSKLKFRDKPKTFNNGSGIGHVRKEEWLYGRP